MPMNWRAALAATARACRHTRLPPGRRHLPAVLFFRHLRGWANDTCAACGSTALAEAFRLSELSTGAALVKGQAAEGRFQAGRVACHSRCCCGCVCASGQEAAAYLSVLLRAPSSCVPRRRAGGPSVLASACSSFFFSNVLSCTVLCLSRLISFYLLPPFSSPFHSTCPPAFLCMAYGRRVCGSYTVLVPSASCTSKQRRPRDSDACGRFLGDKATWRRRRRTLPCVVAGLRFLVGVFLYGRRCAWRAVSVAYASARRRRTSKTATAWRLAGGGTGRLGIRRTALARATGNISHDASASSLNAIFSPGCRSAPHGLLARSISHCFVFM